MMQKIDVEGRLRDADVSRVMDEVDKTGDGFIDYAEFAAWLRGPSSSAQAIPTRRFLHDVKTILDNETPKERLLRCHRELDLGIIAALPPPSTTVRMEEADLWIFKMPEKRGVFDTNELPPRQNETGSIMGMMPGNALYRAGVRVGWRVVEIEGRAVVMSHDIHSQVAKKMGGGGGAKRGCTISLVASEAIEAHKAAEAAMVILREALEQAQAAYDASGPHPEDCESSTAGSASTADSADIADVEAASSTKVAIAEAAVVKFYNSEVCFPIARGCLKLQEINEKFCISEIMPGSKIHLAEQVPEDAYIVGDGEVGMGAYKVVERDAHHTATFNGGSLGIFFDAATGCLHGVTAGGQGEREGTMPGWFFHRVDGLPYSEKALNDCTTGCRDFNVVFREENTFGGLVADQTYFLIVEQSPEVPKREVEWRARMKKTREAERHASLPVHDCRKEQAPTGLHVSTRQGEFEAVLDRREGRSLGMNTELDDNDDALRVEEIAWWGVTRAWNTSYPLHEVRWGDRIVEINGVRGKASVLAKELQKEELLKIKLRRIDYEIGDEVEGRHMGEWTKAEIVEHHGDGFFKVQWLNGLDTDRIKGLFDLRKDPLQDPCHTKVAGHFFFAGSRLGRGLYMNKAGAIVQFQKDWRIFLSEDAIGCCYSVAGGTTLAAPAGDWPSPINPGKAARITHQTAMLCRVCAPDLAMQREICTYEN